MADEMPPPPGACGQPERRRPAPTIDLKATELASEPVKAAATGPAQTRAREASSPDPDTEPKMPPKSAVHRSVSALAASVSWPLVGAGLAGAILTLGIVWVVESSIGSDSSAVEAQIMPPIVQI